MIYEAKKRIGAVLGVVAILCNYTMCYAYAIPEQMNTGSITYEMSNGQEADDDDLADCKNILLKSGMPQEVLATLSDSNIEYIAMNITQDDLYESSESYIIEIDTVSSINSSSSSARGVESLTKDQIKISVTSYSVTHNSEKLAMIFPSFEWCEAGTGISNDSFSFSLGDGWKVRTDLDSQMAVYMSPATGDDYNPTVYLPYVNNKHGCSYRIPLDDFPAAVNQTYEGHAIFYAKKENSEVAENELWVNYTHDMTSEHKASYSIDIGIFAVDVEPSEGVANRVAQYEKSLLFQYK